MSDSFLFTRTVGVKDSSDLNHRISLLFHFLSEIVSETGCQNLLNSVDAFVSVSTFEILVG